MHKVTRLGHMIKKLTTGRICAEVIDVVEGEAPEYRESPVKGSTKDDVGADLELDSAEPRYLEAPAVVVSICTKRERQISPVKGSAYSLFAPILMLDVLRSMKFTTWSIYDNGRSLRSRKL